MFKKKKVEHDVEINLEFRFYSDNTALIQMRSQAKNEWAQLIGELMTYAYLVRHAAHFADSNKDMMISGIQLGSQFRDEMNRRPNQFRTLVENETLKPKRILNNSFWISFDEGKWNGEWKPKVTFGDNCWEESIFLFLVYLSNLHSNDEEFLNYLDAICSELISIWKDNRITKITNFYEPGNVVISICDQYLKKFMNSVWKSQGMTDEQIDEIMNQMDFLHSAEEMIGSKFTAEDLQFILTGKFKG